MSQKYEVIQLSLCHITNRNLWWDERKVMVKVRNRDLEIVEFNFIYKN